MRSDDDIDFATGRPFQNVRLLGVRPKTAQHLDGDRKSGHAFHERLVVLLAKHRRRHENRHLLAIEDSPKRRPHRDFRLAVTDVAAEQTIHRLVGLHVRQNGFNGCRLIRRLRIGERTDEGAFPFDLRFEALAGRFLPHRFNTQHVRRQIPRRRSGGVLRLPPRHAAELAQRRRRLARAHVAADKIHLIQRHIQTLLFVKFQFDDFLDFAA